MFLRKVLMLSVLMVLPMTAVSKSAIPEMLEIYRSQGASNFTSEGVAELWKKTGLIKKGVERNCTTCHGKDLTKNGEHAKTGKVIKPMSLTVNAKRFTKKKKIKKWFKRNCKWTWGRECTPQEKGNFLMYLKEQ